MQKLMHMRPVYIWSIVKQKRERSAKIVRILGSAYYLLQVENCNVVVTSDQTISVDSSRSQL